MKMRWVLGITALVLFGLVAVGVAQQAQHVMVTPPDLKWADGPPSVPPGAKVAIIEGVLANPEPFTLRLKFPANYRVGPHWHTAIEHITVLSGTLNFGMGEKFDAEKTKPMPVGSFIYIQPKNPHFVFAKEETVIQLHGVGPWTVTYVNPEDDPRKKK